MSYVQSLAAPYVDKKSNIVIITSLKQSIRYAFITMCADMWVQICAVKSVCEKKTGK